MKNKISLACGCLSVASIIASAPFSMAEEKPLNFIEKRIAANNKTRAISYASQIKLALIEFEFKYGARPGEAMVGVIAGSKATSANDCFRQLIQSSNTLRSEAIFSAPSKISKKPDGDIGNKDNNFKQACAKGEVGFIYVDAPDARIGAPIAAAPVLDAKTGKFDHRMYDGKAVVLHSDGSVQLYAIDPKTGKVIAEMGGKKVDIFSTENPNFRSAPKIKYPEPKKLEKKSSK